MQIELVLGSGAAHGLAHIGVLEELTAREDVSVVGIHGTSMGALVGAAWAAGSLGRLRDLAEATGALRGLLRFADPSLSLRSLIRGRRVEALLGELFGDGLLEDLPVPVTAVAVDLDAWELVRLDRGPVREAVRASIGIPGIFAPYPHRHRRLVDGTLMSTLPIPDQPHPQADRTIAVSVLGRPAPDDRAATRRRTLMPATLMRTFDIMQNSIQQQAIAAHPEIELIEVSVGVEHSLALHHAAAIIEAGRTAARRVLDTL